MMPRRENPSDLIDCGHPLPNLLRRGTEEVAGSARRERLGPPSFAATTAAALPPRFAEFDHLDAAASKSLGNGM
jgi:hypothetical protein